MNVLQILLDRREFFLECLLDHIRISATAVLIASILGITIGIFISYHKKWETPVLSVVNVIYTIPSIALLGFLIPFTGIGNKTAIIALTIYGIMPMVRNTYAGITGVDPDIIEAAKGMGSTEKQILFRIKLPLAMGVILAGIRNMVVMVIAVTGIASFVGAGGLGVAIYRGITIYNPAMTAAGSILIALLALISDFLLGKLEKYFRKRGSV